MMEVDEENKRFQILGFKPQKENVYNKLLPYADKLDAESNKLFSDIKSNLVKSVLCREMRPGCLIWTSRLHKYIKIYGLKFSKEDHIGLVLLYYELLTIPNLEPTRIIKFASTLSVLLKKKLLSPDELQLNWRPLHDMATRALEKNKSGIGMYTYPPAFELCIESMIRICRIYFPVEATQEILDEFRPKLCLNDVSTAIELFELFLPVVVKPEKVHLGYGLWLEELMHFWKVCHNASKWENCLMWLLARLANHNPGQIDWEPYIPIMFVRFRRTFHLPVSYRKKQSAKQYKIDSSAMAIWIVYCIGGENKTTFFHLEKLMQTLETYYHSANSGKWSHKIRDLLKKLATYFVQRVHCERYKKRNWESRTPDHYKLTDNDIERFINIMKPCLEQAMFSRQGNQDVAVAMQYLSTLRPDIIAPIVLEKLYSAMDSLTEPHKLTSSMICLMSIARFMVQDSKEKYPEGPVHIFPILQALLPAIDPNDTRKCFVTFNIIAHFCNLAPLVNSSEAYKYYDDLTEEEHTVCEASACMEDFVLQFFDRICVWVESNSLEFTRLEQPDSDSKSRLESMSESALFSVITSVLYQCSPQIFMVALKKIHSFATDRILESKVSGKLMAILCACFVKANPKETFKLFLPGLCDTIETLLGENDDVIMEDGINDELLYNLLILAEILDGQSEIVNYIDRLNKILERMLHMNSNQGSKLASHMLTVILTSLSFTKPLEYRSCNKPYTDNVQDFFTVREWGKAADIKNLNITWHQPGQRDVDCIQSLLQKYLVPELDILNKYADGEVTLERKELRRRVRIVFSFLGCQSVLPLWEEPDIQLVDSVLDPWGFKLIIGDSLSVTMPDGQNVRKVIADTIHRVQKRVLEVDEGDTKSIFNIIFIYNTLLFNKFRGRDFETHWKRFHLIKKIMEDRLHQNKRHLRFTLIDRVMLHQEFRNESCICTFTETHKQIVLDLFELSTSHYSEVRIVAQKKLFAALGAFAYAYQILLPPIKEILKMDTSVNHEKFKGCLYVLLGTKGTSIVTRHDWGMIRDLWPLIIKSQPSEKPSIVNLMLALSENLKHFPTITIKLEVPDRCIEAAHKLVNNVPSVSLDGFERFISNGANVLITENEERVLNYTGAVQSILDCCIDGNLHWRYYSMAVNLLKSLVHIDVKYNPELVKFFLNCLINDSLEIRKIALRVIVYVLCQNKPTYKKVTVDPYSFGTSSDKNAINPGIRPDNQWLLYNSKTKPLNAEEWNKARYVHKNDVGYYAWPKTLEVYAPSSEQPKFSDRREQLNQQEIEILNFFTEQNVEIIIKYFSMEEKKGKDVFNGFRFLMFKYLFKIYDDHFLHLLMTHVEKLINDNQEQSQRCATEIIGGMIRGSKHWTFDKVEKLWSMLIPILNKAFSNITVETLTDWGICLTISLNSRDPNRYHWLLEFLINNPLNEQTSFLNSSRVYLLQNALSQQSWRNVELSCRLLNYLKDYLSHPFQNVRDRISGCLTVIFSEDLGISNGYLPKSVTVKDFFIHVMPKLNNLYESTIEVANQVDKNSEGDVTSRLQLISLSNEDKDEKIRLFKTVAKYVTGSVTRMNYAAVPEHYNLLPLACVLQSNDTDDELATICTNLVAVIGHTFILDEYVPAALATIKTISTSPFWTARVSIAEFISVLVFHNFSTIITNDEWVNEIQTTVLFLLEDIQPEVREASEKVMSGFLHCQFVPDPSALLKKFKSMAKTKLHNRNSTRNLNDGSLNNGNKMLCIRHAGVLGMCAFVSSHPYDVPDYVSDIFQELGKHLNDPQPIPSTIRRTLDNFKRTHYDNWESHKLKFTEEELLLLSDLTVPPSYYA